MRQFEPNHPHEISTPGLFGTHLSLWIPMSPRKFVLILALIKIAKLDPKTLLFFLQDPVFILVTETAHSLRCKVTARLVPDVGGSENLQIHRRRISGSHVKLLFLLPKSLDLRLQLSIFEALKRNYRDFRNHLSSAVFPWGIWHQNYALGGKFVPIDFLICTN